MSRLQRFALLLAINIGLLLAMAVAVESAAWLALRANDWRIARQNQELEKQDRETGTGPTSEPAFYSDPRVPEQMAARASMQGSPYHYVPYLIYRNRPYRSELVNVGADGFRVNGNDFDELRPRTYTIWMLGSSAVFGVTNADADTIPSQLERILSERYPDVRIHVLNRGVVGYSSLQDYLSLRFGLTASRPDMVVTVNGVNDHYYVWSATGSDNGLTRAGIGNGVPDYYWGFHARGGIVNRIALRQLGERLFSNSLDAWTKLGRFFALSRARSAPEAWKAGYRQRAALTLASVKRAIPTAREFFLGNMAAIAQATRDRGIELIFSQQPALFASSKPLVGSERRHRLHGLLSWFALSSDELADLARIEPYHIDKQGFWDLEFFVESYRAQDAALRRLSQELGAGYVNLQAVVDAQGAVPVFASPVHYTRIGTRVIAEALADEIASRNPPGLAAPLAHGPLAPIRERIGTH